MNIDNNTIECTLLAMASDEDLAINNMLDFIQSLWTTHPSLCETAITLMFTKFSDSHIIVDNAVSSIVSINSTDLETLALKVADIPGVPPHITAQLTGTLMRPDKILSDTDQNKLADRYKKCIISVVEGTSDPHGFFWPGIARDLLRLHLCSLRDVVDQLLELPRPIFNYESRTLFSTFLNSCTTEGLKEVFATASDHRSEVTLRAACTFSIGCTNRPACHTILRDIYFSSQRRSQFPIRLAAVESIVYSSNYRQVDSFLLEALRIYTTRHYLNRSCFSADVALLMSAVSFSSHLSNDLLEQLRLWRSAQNRDLSAEALCAAETHGYSDHAWQEELGTVYHSIKEFRKSAPSLLGLMCFRRRFANS